MSVDKNTDVNGNQILPMKYAVFFLYTGLAAWLSLAPADNSTLPLLATWDKAMHATLYAVFALLGALLCSSPRQLVWLATAIFVYSGVLEIGQNFVPSRTMEILDLVANGLGIALAVVAAVTLTPQFKHTGVSTQ